MTSHPRINRLCSLCGVEISQERLLALPNVRECISCRKENDVTHTTGFMSWEHKTAPSIVTSAEVGEEGIRYLRKHDRRGVHAQLSLGSAKNPRLVASMRTTVGRAEFDAIRPRQEEAEPPLERLTDGLAAHCHPARPRVGPSGHCLECAIEWYSRRKA